MQFCIIFQQGISCFENLKTMIIVFFYLLYTHANLCTKAISDHIKQYYIVIYKAYLRLSNKELPVVSYHHKADSIMNRS